MNSGGQPHTRSGAIPVPPLHHGGPNDRLPATVIQQPTITQSRNPLMSHQQAQQAYRAIPQVQAPHPPANVVPHQLNRVAEQSDLRGENLTEEEYREFLTEYIIYRFEKVGSHVVANSNDDQVQGSWANCTRRRLPTVDKQEAKKEINNLNREDRRKGRSLLEKQMSLSSIQQDQLKKLESDLSSNAQLDSRFQIILTQIHYTLRPIVGKHESISRRRNATKRKVREKKKRSERTSITAYFKRCPQPEQVPSLLYRQIQLEKHQGQHMQDRQTRQNYVAEQMRERQERIEQAHRVAEQQAQQQQQAQLLRQQNQLQTQQAQLQKQQFLQQQRQQQTQQQQQQAQHHGRALGPQQQAHHIRPGQGQVGQIQATNNRTQQSGRLPATPYPPGVYNNIGKQLPHAAHGPGRVDQGKTAKVPHQNDHRSKGLGHRHDSPSILSSDSDSICSDDDSSSLWDSETSSDRNSDFTPTSSPSRSSGSYHAGKSGYNSRRHVHKHSIHQRHRSQHRHHRPGPSHTYHEPRYHGNSRSAGIDHHRSRRHSLQDARDPPAYILTSSDRRLPVLVPEVPRRSTSPVFPVTNVEAIRVQAYHEGRSDQKYEDRTRLATAAVERLDARRYRVPPSSSPHSSAPRYEPRTAPRPVIVTEREMPRMRHVSNSEVGRQLDSAFGRLRLADLERDRDVRGVEEEYELLFPDRVSDRRRASFVRVGRDVRSGPHWARSEDDEDWNRGSRDWRRESRSPSPLMTPAPHNRNPFAPDSPSQRRFDDVYTSERGRQRLF